MYSPRDFQEKQVVVLMNEEFKKMTLKNRNLCVRDEEGTILHQLSLAKIFLICVVGECSVTTKLMRQMSQFQIAVVFLNYNLALIQHV